MDRLSRQSEADDRFGSWSCQNYWTDAGFDDPDDRAHMFCRPGYARVAAMSGWMPTMFITRVRFHVKSSPLFSPKADIGNVANVPRLNS
jgi:hypothetical protein